MDPQEVVKGALCSVVVGVAAYLADGRGRMMSRGREWNEQPKTAQFGELML